jgi:MFS family permease
MVAIFLANILVCFHYYTILYINSSYLSLFFSGQVMSALYILGSGLSLFFLFQAPKIIAQTGTYRFLLLCVIIEGLAVYGLALTQTSLSAALLFIIHQTVIVLVLFNLDLYLEAETKQENHTGEIRGSYLTLGNAALILSPLIVSFLSNEAGYANIYFFSAALIVPLILLVMGPMHSTPVATPKKTAFWVLARELRDNKNLRSITLTHLVLQIFYGFMAIYMPLYLHLIIGFSWPVIGVMFTIMFLPFILFEIPVGILADKKWGEKEIMIIGLVITALSTFLIPLITVPSFALWSAVLFLSRVGASLVEVTTESAFFKHINAEHTHFIGVFRSMRSVGFIIAPIFGGIALLFSPYSFMFILLGIVVSFGLFPARLIRDTK